MVKNCPHCELEINYEKHQQFGAHVTNCKMNPKKQLIKDKIKESKEIKNPTSLFNLNCKWCNQDFSLELKEKDYINDKYKKFCSKKCSSNFSRSFVDETKLKDSSCKKCGEPIKINIRSSNNIYCDNCKNCIKSHCKLCGQDKCINEYICSKYRLINSLKRLGFDETKLGSIEFYTEFNKIKNLMIEEYEVKELPLIQIGIKYDINFQTLSSLFKNLDIKIRTISESNFLYVKNNSNPLPHSTKYKCGWHESWRRTKHFYRSSFELDYFTKLDEDKVVYETESLRIEYFDSVENKLRIAIPDIFIPSDNLIIEIKSDYSYNEINMDDKIISYKKLGYKMDLILGHGKKLFKNFEIKNY